jgi:hypothetical protein
MQRLGLFELPMFGGVSQSPLVHATVLLEAPASGLKTNAMATGPQFSVHSELAASMLGDATLSSFSSAPAPLQPGRSERLRRIRLARASVRRSKS